MDGFLTIKETSAKWGLGERRINTLCQEGRIPGVQKFGKSWVIPADAEKPKDKRIKSGKYVKEMSNLSDFTDEEEAATTIALEK